MGGVGLPTGVPHLLKPRGLVLDRRRSNLELEVAGEGACDSLGQRGEEVGLGEQPGHREVVRHEEHHVALEPSASIEPPLDASAR